MCNFQLFKFEYLIANCIYLVFTSINWSVHCITRGWHWSSSIINHWSSPEESNMCIIHEILQRLVLMFFLLSHIFNLSLLLICSLILFWILLYIRFFICSQLLSIIFLSRKAAFVQTSSENISLSIFSFNHSYPLLFLGHYYLTYNALGS